MLLCVELYNFYTYAFLETPTAELELPVGIRDRVLLISSAGVSALVEPEISIESLQNDDERLIQAVLSHDRVMGELFRQTTVLPLRFGTCFTSKESLLTYLEFHAQEYLEKLRLLNGKAEYILKFVPRTLDEPVITPLSGGRQYFLAKKQRYQTQQDFQNIQTAQRENAVDLITQIYKSAIVVQPEGEEARIYLLVSRQDEPLLTEQFLTWQKACSHWELQLEFALPPYHFI
ncbi:MAG: GvpL/GvpF family gas vesicle protein [Rhizonema sp. PD38]|nr:GvpL/GvpF family gas vesicle protein [Rhizonema sp. PD38]